MPAQYAWADGIISAGGSTCWEWLHAGLPGAIVTIAANQLPIVQALTETRRAALPLGWFQKFAPDVQGPFLAAWLETPESVTDQDAARSVIDGYGTHRVASFVRGSRLTVRRAQASDCDLYFAWANDAEVRKNSFSPSLIPYEDHVKWFFKRLKVPNSRLLVGFDFNGNPVGQVRFDFKEQRNAWIVDISVDPNCRGKGVGKNLMAEGLNWLRVCNEANTLVEAEVLDSNPGSMQLFERNGFEMKRFEEGFVSYRKTV
jgi:ribosomal protein S18 acetylase RimI-like enzyme